MREKLAFHPIVWTLLIGTVFARGASFMALPFLALYLSGTHHVHPVLVGLTIGLSPLFSTVGGFLGGYVSDRVGRKRVLLITIFIWASVYIGFAIADHIAVFMILNSINGLCRSFFEPTSQAMISDIAPQSQRRRIFSLRYTAINIGAAGGPLLGVYVAQFSSSYPFFFTGGMYVLYGIALVVMLNKHEVKRVATNVQLKIGDALILTWKDKTLLLFIIGGILINIGYSQIDSNLPQHLQGTFDDGVKLFSRLIALNAVLVIIMQYPLSVFSEKWPVLHVMIAGSLLFSIGFAAFGYVTTPTGFMIAMAVVTAGEILVFPSTSVFIDYLAPEERRGTYFGAAQLRSIGHFTGPILGGWLLSTWNGSVLFSVIAVVLLSSIGVYWLVNKRMEHLMPEVSIKTKPATAAK